MSLLTEEFEENTEDEDEDAAIVELVAAAIVELVAAIVSIIDGSDTMKSFDTQKIQRITKKTQRRRKTEKKIEEQRERERLREKISS